MLPSPSHASCGAILIVVILFRVRLKVLSFRVRVDAIAKVEVSSYMYPQHPDVYHASSWFAFGDKVRADIASTNDVWAFTELRVMQTFARGFLQSQSYQRHFWLHIPYHQMPIILTR
jgi:hypothetical protein